MNIFVAGLSFNVNNADLASLFEEYGTVTSAKIVTDRQSGRSKGYGFVEMDDDEAAEKAIAELNDVEFEGRTIAVSEAKPREERPRNSFGGGNRGGGGGGFRRRY
jgi:RNA recognition motif-containing protein